ncbi:fibrinogen-binding adhesin SdrG C-terminal domain-containing protein [Staphylococcus pseudintermedius]|nr:fibrinogen-binding adhesin SdrG C-terminal domain-containing protein [Staphylococcus pseudintermedius]
MYENKREKHAIRKFSVGTASIVIGGLIYGFMGDNEAQASKVSFNNLGENKVEFNAQNPQAPQQTYTEVTIKENQTSESKALENRNSQPEEKAKVEVVESEQPKTKSSSVEENTVIDIQRQEAVKKEENPLEITQKLRNKAVDVAPKKELSRAIQPVTNVDQDVRTKNENTTVGKDVSSQVIVENGEIMGFKNGNNIHPHHGQGGRLNYKLKFPQDVKSGDTFKIQLSDNVNTHGISVERGAPNIVDRDVEGKEGIIAEGKVLEDGRTIIYTFKDYVNGKQNLTADLSISYFTSHEKVRESGKQLVTSTIGSSVTSSDIYVYYDNSYYVDGRISELNKKEGKFKQIAYINPYGYLNGRGTVSVNGDVVSGASKVSTTPKVTIYKHKGYGNPQASIYIEPNMWEVVNLDEDSINYHNGGYSLNLDVKNGQKYAIYYEGQYDSAAPELLYRTYIQTNDYYYPFSKQKLNGVKLYENNASGSGELKPVPPPKPNPEVHNNLVETTEDSNVIDISWDTVLDEENGENKGPQEEVEEHQIIDIIEDTTPEGESGQNEGSQEEVEEHHIIDIIEDTTPEGESGQNGDSQEEVEEHHVIDIIEDTTPEGESGQNEGSQEEVEEHQIIDIIADTTPEGESGQNEGSQEEVEEHQIVDIIEDTTPEGESGQNGDSQEEVEEHHIIDIIEDTTPEGESGENEGHQEEIEEHHIIDIIEDTTSEGESGQNEGNQEEVEEHQVIDIIADTTPEGESGENEGNQEEVEEHQVIDIIEDTTPEGESGQNEGNQEEIEEHQVIDRVGGKAPERKGGQIERNQEKIEEHPINAPVINVSTSLHKNAVSKSVKVLPSTGEAHKNTPTLAILLTVIGSVLLFRRKSKFNKAK